MKQFESGHYIFTKAERDIESIAIYQESCFRYICNTLGITSE